MITDFEDNVGSLTKDELGAELMLEGKDIRRNNKSVLVSKFIGKHNDEVSKRRFYKKYSDRFAIHPTKVQELLQMSSTERKRWTEQGKLIVACYDSFYKWGKTIEYPLYDALELSKLSSEIIETWREEHKKNVRKNRQRGAKKSRKTREKNQSIQRAFYENEWKKMLGNWFKTDGKLGATLQLSFWTVWLNRWAKEYQTKAHLARTKGDEYVRLKDRYYELKNNAMELLIRSPYTTLSFYRPSFPHKRFNVQFCADHYNLWYQLREFDYIGKREFFEMYGRDITKCSDCSFDQINDYYSLYYLSVKHDEIKDVHFSFHIPYPVGKHIFPQKHKLDKVVHDEQEGMFRFGRTLFREEKIIFTEKEVLKHYEDAREKFLLYFP